MILHLASELPELKSSQLDMDSLLLTQEEVRILKSQIRKNAQLADAFIERLDLLVNKEKHSNEEDFVKRLRHRLGLLIEENDTFRKVLWKHMQQDEVVKETRGGR